MMTDDKSHRLVIGRKLAEIRKNRGYTVRELAEISGVSFQNVTKIENGKYNVSIDILHKITSALGVEIEIRDL